MQSQIHIGTLVRNLQGQMVGVVRYLVINPHTNQLTHLITDKLEAKASLKVIACSELAERGEEDDPALVVALNEAQLALQPDFNESNYVWAPGPFGGPARPFYHWQGRNRIPLQATYLYALETLNLGNMAEAAIASPVQSPQAQEVAGQEHFPVLAM